MQGATDALQTGLFSATGWLKPSIEKRTFALEKPFEEKAPQSPAPVRLPAHLRAVGEPSVEAPQRKTRRRTVKRKTNPEEFFKQPLPHSKIKTAIVAEYFAAWANIIKSRTRSGRMAYFDLFAGPGVYEDGTPSTPVFIMKTIIKEPTLREQVLSFFGDESPACIEKLKATFAALPGIDTLKHAPEIEVQSAKNSGLDKDFETARLVPSFMFLDPFGYEGVTAKLIRSVLKDWGCDVIFFFCFKRMPGAIRNDKVRPHMNELFGSERVDSLRILLPTLTTTAEKEAAILAALEESLNGMGGRFVQTFRFRNEHGTVTHHLVLVTKSDTAQFIMKGIMASHSTGKIEDVSSFEYMTGAPEHAPLPLFGAKSPVDALADDLLVKFSGRTILLEDVCKEHQYKTPYLLKHYAEALRRLCYDRRAVTAVRGAHSPPLKAERRDMPQKNTYITFPKASTA